MPKELQPTSHRYTAEAEFAYLAIEQPDFIVQSLTDITRDKLQGVDVGLLMIDIDGTITSDGGGLQAVSEETIEHINDLSRDFLICFVTMSSRRAGDLHEYFGQPYPVFGPTSLPEHLRVPGLAPWTTKNDHPELFFGRALQHFDVEPQQAVAIGDEIGADIVAPRRLGLKTILVDGFNMKRIEECLNDSEFMEHLSEHFPGQEKQTWRRSLLD